MRLANPSVYTSLSCMITASKILTSSTWAFLDASIVKNTHVRKCIPINRDGNRLALQNLSRSRRIFQLGANNMKQYNNNDNVNDSFGCRYMNDNTSKRGSTVLFASRAELPDEPQYFDEDEFMGKKIISQDDDEDYDDEYNDADDETDWRSFRAQLVSMEGQKVNTMKAPSTKQQQHNHQSSTGSNGGKESAEDEALSGSWIYETGTSIESGTVLLHHPPSNKEEGEQGDEENVGFGLGRQYLHKSVVLIVEHASNDRQHTSSKGIILNRPTDLILYDEPPGDHANSKESGFAIWYGGQDYGIHTEEPKFYCLHSIKSAAAKRVSKQVMNGIYFTSIENAKDLVEANVARPRDFWVFCGFVWWEDGELVQDIEDGLWHSVATDSAIVQKGLHILTDADAIDVVRHGAQTWNTLMKMIGQDISGTSTNTGDSTSFEERQPLHYAKNYLHGFVARNFDDLILKEWAKKHLIFDKTPLFLQDSYDSNDGDDGNADDDSDSSGKPMSGALAPGTLIRGSSNGTPFLFEDQEFHKSLMLVVQDDYELSVGLLLNQPSTKSFDFTFRDQSTFFDNLKTIKLPIRYGGALGASCDDGDNRPLFILHMNAGLREANVGEPVGEHYPDGVWSCTMDQCLDAIADRIASPEDFMSVDGFCLWTKNVNESDQVEGGILPEVSKGNFEIVPHGRTEAVWKSLLAQQVLNPKTIHSNFDIGQFAWRLAKSSTYDQTRTEVDSFDDEEDAKLLSDEALKRWMMANLFPR